VDRGVVIDWRSSVTSGLVTMRLWFEGVFGFPADDDMVCDPDPVGVEKLALCGSAIPPDLLDFYAVVGKVSLPNVGNGWFIDHPRDLAGAFESGELRKITGRFSGYVVAFASDGGGTRYAMAATSGRPVYRLPPDAVFDGVYESMQPRFEPVAVDLADFLMKVGAAVVAFSRNGAIVDL
jgi:hypothetical protein